MEYLQSDLGEIKISNWKMVLEDICKYANVSDNGATAMFIIFWDVLIDEQIFFSSQVKQSAIVINKHGIRVVSWIAEWLKN